jgi:hypothetical protein
MSKRFPNIEDEIVESGVEYSRSKGPTKPPKPIGDKLDTSLPTNMPPPPVRESLERNDNEIRITSDEIPPERDDSDPGARRRARRGRLEEYE